MDRYEAVQWLQKELGNNERAAHMVDWLQEAWETMDALREQFPGQALVLLFAKKSLTIDETSPEPTVTVQSVSISELIALGAACAWYRAELQRGADNAETRVAIEALQRLHQRLLTITVDQYKEDA